MNATALNQKIARVSVKNTTVLRDTPTRALARRLEGRKIRFSRRHGKFLFGLLDRGGAMVFHFGMTGYLRYFKERSEEPKYTRVRFDFSNRAFLGYVSLRMLGLVDYASDVDEYVRKRGLGPDALKLSAKEFEDRLAGKKASIKSALMNQGLLAGVGNIYSDEILFMSRVHPARRVDQLSKKNRRGIHKAMRYVLSTAIRKRADPRWLPASWLLHRRGKKARCPRCGKEIQRMKIQQRSAYFCPNCQRRK